ncbi:hypothetical protein Tco_0443110, partial [Tanacetum coccineum]
RFVEEPVEIMDREVKRLKQSRIPIIKVRWNSRRGPEFTWEREDQFWEKRYTLQHSPAQRQTHIPLRPILGVLQIGIRAKIMPPRKAPRTRTTTTNTTSITNAQLQAMIDQGVAAALATHDANRSTNGEDSHNSGMGVRRTECVA